MRALRRDSAGTIFPDVLRRGGWLRGPTDFLRSFGLSVFCILDSHDRFSITTVSILPSVFRDTACSRLKDICSKDNRNAALRDG